jgi:hypothetical protein
MTSIPLDPEDYAVEVLHALAVDEQDGMRHTVRLGPYSIWCAITALQLASRHPNLSAPMCATLRRIGDTLAVELAEPARSLVVLGWDRTLDR